MYSARLHATCPGSEASPNYCQCCCLGCLHNCAAHNPDHGSCEQPSRMWWSKQWDSAWWNPLILIGIRGGDEWCNRTIGLRLPGGALFLALNIPLRREVHDACLADCVPRVFEQVRCPAAWVDRVHEGHLWNPQNLGDSVLCRGVEENCGGTAGADS